MRVEGSVHFDVAPPAAWQFLTDPARISQCTPGVAEWITVSPNRRFQVRGVLAIGAQTRVLEIPADIEWVHFAPPHRLDVAARTQIAGQPFMLNGTLRLAPADTQTALTFVVEAAFPAGANRFMRELVARQLPLRLEQFFRCVKASLTAAPGENGRDA